MACAAPAWYSSLVPMRDREIRATHSHTRNAYYVRDRRMATGRSGRARRGSSTSAPTRNPATERKKHADSHLSLRLHLPSPLLSFYLFSLLFSRNTHYPSVSPSLPPAASLGNLPTIPCAGATTRSFVDPARSRDRFIKAGSGRRCTTCSPRLVLYRTSVFFLSFFSIGVSSINSGQCGHRCGAIVDRCPKQ